MLLFILLLLLLTANLLLVGVFVNQYTNLAPTDPRRPGLRIALGLMGLNVIAYLTIYALSANGYLQFLSHAQ